LRITWLFDIKNSEEVAVTGVSATEPGWTDTACETTFNALTNFHLDALDNAMLAFLTAANQGLAMAHWGRYTGVKVAAIGADGKYITDPILKMRDVPQIGTQLGPLPQTTVCLSLRALTSIGPATKGRMYIPYSTVISWDDTIAPRMLPAYAQNIANRGAELIGSVNNALEDVPVGRSAACSILQTTPAGSTKPPVSQLIHDVLVGDIVDTQRKRRNRLQEIYSSAAVDFGRAAAADSAGPAVE